MRAITVRQPWAWAIVHAGKRIENRSQLFAYRGELAIHAGLNRAELPQYHRALVAAWKAYGQHDLVFGAVIGVTTLLDAHVASPRCCESAWAMWPPREGATRPVTHLVLGDVARLRKPVEARGALGVWAPDDELRDAIDRERRAA